MCEAQKILLGDDHPMIRKGLQIALSSLFPSGIQVYEASSCNSIMKELARNEFTHIILDVELSDVSILEILPNIVNLYPDIRIAIYSMQPENIYARQIHQFGISYYISKGANECETIALFKKFVNNESLTNSDDLYPENPFSNLTARELEILYYLLKGVGSVEIAQTLNLFWNSVSRSKSNIFKKTNVKNFKELIDIAKKYNIIRS